MLAVDYVRRGWTQGAMTRDENGVSCVISGRPAVRWCAWGALDAAYPSWQEVKAARERLRDVIGASIMSWNDYRGRTQEEVIAAFEKARI